MPLKRKQNYSPNGFSKYTDKLYLRGPQIIPEASIDRSVHFSNDIDNASTTLPTSASLNYAAM
jgi:hypothetical protein